MGQALYRKYRSRSLKEVVGQDHITKTLENALKSGKISHAYLFTGPRGVGKTSVARILAHEVNKLPYTDESIHLDIIEIDAASNRRIDEIRDLRDKVHIAPTSAKYKVYIIDEVHMLTREAFNALLKTLEEPPAHCIFILATTEAHKLPETIISRTQRYNFRPIGSNKATKHLQDLAKKEGIEITADALELLAKHGGGSFRDSISLLDQLGSVEQQVTSELVRSMLGLPEDTLIEDLLGFINNGDSAGVLNCLNTLLDQSANPAMIASGISNMLRIWLISGRNEPWISELLRELLEVPASNQPYENLEISLLSAATKNIKIEDTNNDNKNVKPPTPNQTPPEIKQDVSNSPKLQSPKEKPQISKSTDFDLNEWPNVVSEVKNRAASLYTALRLAIPDFEDNTLILKFQFPLHQKKVNQAKHKDIINSVVEEVTGKAVKIECIVDKSVFKKSLPAIKIPEIPAEENNEPETNQLQTINNIFGAAEMLES